MENMEHYFSCVKNNIPSLAFFCAGNRKEGHTTHRRGLLSVRLRSWLPTPTIFTAMHFTLSRDLLVCRASSTHQNSLSIFLIFLICRSRNITGTCPASTNGRPASASQLHQPPASAAFCRLWSRGLSISPYDAI